MSQVRKQYFRFGVWERVEHFVLILSFTILSLTGIPQKFALNPLSQGVIGALGGIETIRIIHRVAAAVFLLEAIYHAVVIGYKLYVQRKAATMLPGVKDGVDAIQWFRYNLGMSNRRPKMPRYNFMEKAEYWAMIWGLLLMGLTGLMLWNPIATTNILPGQFIPAAKAAHGGEALLAVLAIILWHFYHVHIKQFNKSMFTGKMSRHEMLEEHGAELEMIESGALPPDPPAAEVRRRARVYLPVAGLLALVLAGITFYFLTYEESAITTVPPASNGPAFVQPTPTQAPVEPVAGGGGAGGEGAALTWTDSIGPMLADQCASCHGGAGGFSAESYASVMEAVTAGEPENSRIVEVMREGGHPGQLDEESLDRLIEWIDSGAPEAAEGGNAGGGDNAGGNVPTTWEGGVGALFEESCASCHGSMGGFSAESYDSVMEAVKPGDPDGSTVVEVQRAGNHPGMFDENQLNIIINWIQAGAPQQ